MDVDDEELEATKKLFSKNEENEIEKEIEICNYESGFIDK